MKAIMPTTGVKIMPSTTQITTSVRFISFGLVVATSLSLYMRLKRSIYAAISKSAELSSSVIGNGAFRPFGVRWSFRGDHTPAFFRVQTTLGCSVNRMDVPFTLPSSFRKQRSSVALSERATGLLLKAKPLQLGLERATFRERFCSQLPRVAIGLLFTRIANAIFLSSRTVYNV